MKNSKKIFWVLAILLILLRVLWMLPIGEWVSSRISLSRVGMLFILILNVVFWYLVYRCLKKNKRK